MPGSTPARCPPPSGAIPLAEGSDDRFVYPADFICEAIDQTRGWFYSLLAVNTLVRGTTPYRNVLCLGHIVDADGRKMSKSVGNVIDPWEILDTRGADPLRWWMFSQGSPWTPTRVSFEVIDAAMRDTLLTLWNTWSFFTTYASLNGFDPADPAIPARAGPLGARPVDALPARRHGGRGHRSPSTATSRSRPPPPSPRWSTTSPTGTCGAAGAGSGGPTRTPTRPTRSAPRPPCTRCW